jgi:NTP pyrophosphatase (non-canonical NTP hydrolase)
VSDFLGSDADVGHRADTDSDSRGGSRPRPPGGSDAAVGPPDDGTHGRASGQLTVGQLQRRLAEFAAARDWGRFHTPKNLAAALSVEASELLEIFQWLTPEESARVMERPETAHRVEDEVADVLAYLLQLCEVLGVDALLALTEKMERNEKRFPATGIGHSME